MAGEDDDRRAAQPPGPRRDAERDARPSQREDPRLPRALDGGARDEDDAPAVPSVPSPTMPKGGGAVRGLGEKFQVNAANGTFSASIPLPTAAARGLEPGLSLQYDSGAGNGPFGEGWSLPVMRISRKTDQALPRYRPDDVFFAGGEDFVPSAWPDGGAWTKGARDAGGYQVQCFRPRVESGFDRFEQWTRKLDGDVYWIARATDGRTTVLGQSPSARVADPADPARVFRWLAERSYDDRGNLISFVWRAEDRVNVAASIWEQGRAPVYTHLDRVRWGLRAPYDPTQPAPADASAYLFELVLDYGERDGVAPGTPPPYAAPSAWTARTDPFSFFKPGFEERCYRLCKRALLFHRVDEAGAQPTLVRELDLRYDGDPSLAKLVGVTALGWRDGASASFPEVRLGWSAAAVDPTVREIDLGSAENLPAPIDGKRTQWVDLDGEGIPGALIEDRPGWFYKRNLGGGALAPVAELSTRPMLELSGGGARLMDLNGDGVKSLVRFGGAAPGRFARDGESFDWTSFAPFSSVANVDLNDPNLRLIDLDGDGRPDVLITEDRLLRWYPSLGYDGLGEPALVPKPTDEARGPALVFADAEQSIYLADMSGDGLTDLVRVRNGQVCYWPSLGYGRFGARVTMGRAPRFSADADFSQSRVRLADVDGTGTTDLLYCDGDRVRCWLNLAGNSFSGEAEVAGLPYDSLATVDAIDLLGNGTSCLVWTSPLPWHSRQPLRYVELTGGVKPHLLISIDNGLGRTCAVEYAASTQFYLQDRAAGAPWITRVPFPVQVVARLTTTDQVAGNTLSAEYSYHHGFYDGVEREFRGFGMVEQRDTQSLSALESQGLFPPGVDFVPPARTRTWFHTGAYLEGEPLIARYRQEWFAGDPDAAQLDGGVIPGGTDPAQWREALRALRGRPLRVEIYGDDQPATAETPIPYSVAESSYTVRLLQPRGDNPHGVFAADPLETLTCYYERVAADPRVEHQVVLQVSPYGAVEEAARVAYARRGASGGLLATYATRAIMDRDTEAELYRVNVPAETRLYEVTGLVAPAASPFVLARAALAPVPLLVGADDLAYDQAPASGRLQRRLLRDTQLSYYADDDVTPLGVGSFGARALLYRAQHARMPATMVASTLPPSVDAAMMTAAGHLSHDGTWWAPSTAVAYDGASFFQPARFTDPFGAVTRVGYDGFGLLPVTVTNALGQTIAVAYDYLALAASSITDVNGNATIADYDALGRVRDVAETGKLGEGDTLAAPTIHYDYTLGNWRALGTPDSHYTRQRLVYQQDGFAERYVYLDGFERELMTKVKADPGPAFAIQGGKLVTVETGDRWIGTGRAVYDNKANPVRKYEPYYAVGSAYETDPQLALFGVTAVLRYDPLSRLTRTDLPDGSFATVTLGAWQQSESDGADNCAEEARLWVNRPGQSAADQRATAATLLHRRTPALHTLDAFGRHVESAADNTQQGAVKDVPPGSHVYYETRSALDVQGRLVQAFDDKGLKAAPPYATLTQAFDMLGAALRQISAESGTAYSLTDCQSQPFYARDARGVELRTSYDVLRRQTALLVNDTAAGVSYTAEKTVYGDDPAAPVDPAANLLGRVWRSYDQAGILTRSSYDFKGNLLAAARQLIATTSGAPDWSASWLTPFALGFQYDALARVTQAILPRRDPTRGVANSMARAYLVQGPLASITLTPQFGAATDVISAIEYDAKGRRVSAAYANGVARRYTYDPLTFRLVSMTATRHGGSETLQSLTYTYDAVGNVTEIADAAQPTVFKHNQAVSPRLAYGYDSIYRLTDASGRELHDPAQPDDADAPWAAWPPDANDLVNYTEHYGYDGSGNLTQVQHRANQGKQSWTRDYGYDPASNRLTGTSLPGAPDPTVLGAKYGYDAAGDMSSMPHLAAIGWDERQRLASADQGGGGVVCCRYGAGGDRVRKIQTGAAAAASGARVQYERIYFGDYEVYRELDAAGNATLEIESVHGLDGGARVVLIETETSLSAPSPAWRYQLDNHLGTATVELDERAALLSYEEYHPFGTTAFHAAATVAETSLKRYRFLAKERDQETGFDYCGARHYCAWLGRWINPDPAGFVDGANLYRYSRNSPIRLADPSGRQSTDEVSCVDPAASTPHEEARQASFTSDHPGAGAKPPEPSALSSQARNPAIPPVVHPPIELVRDPLTVPETEPIELTLGQRIQDELYKSVTPPPDFPSSNAIELAMQHDLMSREGPQGMEVAELVQEEEELNSVTGSIRVPAALVAPSPVRPAAPPPPATAPASGALVTGGRAEEIFNQLGAATIKNPTEASAGWLRSRLTVAVTTPTGGQGMQIVTVQSPQYYRALQAGVVPLKPNEVLGPVPFRVGEDEMLKPGYVHAEVLGVWLGTSLGAPGGSVETSNPACLGQCDPLFRSLPNWQHHNLRTK